MDLKSICAPDTGFKETMIPVNGNVVLRVLIFSGPEKNTQPDIVFVAGWVSLIQGWKEILQSLTAEFRVIYIETREKISSQVTGKANYRVHDIGQDIVAIIRYFNLLSGKYLIMGSSLGATAILDSYRHIEQKPLCLVLIGPNAEFRVPLTWKIIVKSFYPGLYRLIKPSVLWYLRTFRLNIDSDYEQYEKYSRALNSADPWKLRRAVLALSRYQVWEILSSVKCPTLIIGASKDKLHEPDNLKKIVTMLPDARYVDMETNKKTHSRPMIDHLKAFLKSLNNN